MRVRPETPADHEAVAELTEAAFGRPAEARFVGALRESEGHVPELSLVVEEDGALVGHAMLSYVPLEEDGQLLMLAPVSVSPKRQRRGVGSALVRELLARAEARSEPLVLVVGHPAYYPRFGFRLASGLGLLPPHPAIPDDAWMAVPLRAYDPALRGQVTLTPAFALASDAPPPTG